MYNLQLPCEQPPTSSYNLQLPHGRHCHHGRHGHGGHVGHGGLCEHVGLDGQDRTGHSNLTFQVTGSFRNSCDVCYCGPEAGNTTEQILTRPSLTLYHCLTLTWLFTPSLCFRRPWVFSKFYISLFSQKAFTFFISHILTRRHGSKDDPCVFHRKTCFLSKLRRSLSAPGKLGPSWIISYQKPKYRSHRVKKYHSGVRTAATRFWPGHILTLSRCLAVSLSHSHLTFHTLSLCFIRPHVFSKFYPSLVSEKA